MKARFCLLLLLSLALLCACSAPLPGDTEDRTEPPPDTASVTAATDLETDRSSDLSVCNHAFGAWETVTEAKEGESGLKRRLCFFCDEEETEEIPALSTHEHIYTETVYLPDCTEDGFTQKVCLCGDTVTENVIPAQGHSFGEWITAYAPTTQVEGRETRTCQVCGTMEKRSIEKLPPPPIIHVHVYTATVYEPTCTEDGYVVKSCSCGEYYTVTNGKPAGHRFGDWYRVLEPGIYCGLDRRDCTVCGEIGMQTVPVSTEVPWPTPPTGDDDINSDTETDSGVLSEGAGSTTAEGSGSEDTDGGTPSDQPLPPTVTYYSQRDSRWGDLELGCGIMKNNGCGPSAIAMALSYYGINVTPAQVATWLYENTIEFNHTFHGISGTGVRLGLEHYGREVVPITSYVDLYRHLQNGAVVVGCHGQGYFVSKEEGSHCITMVGLNGDGTTYCYDPYNPSKNGYYDVACLWAERSNLAVDLRQEGVTHFAVY